MHSNHDRQINDLMQRVKQLEERLAASELNASEDIRSQFLARISHELRISLNSIIGYAQLFEIKKHQSKLPQNKYINEILKASQHLLLITDWLDISEIEVNRNELAITSVDIRIVIEECLAAIKPLADERRLITSYELKQCPGTWVRADPARLKQVLLNLMSNAVKHNCESGSIDLVCEKNWGNRLRISLTDTGPGIKEEKLKNLFDPFNRDCPENYVVDGSGLGLPLAKRLVELMHGRIGVDSVYGEGSTFWIELDMAEAQPEKIEQHTEYKADYGRSERSTLLYVEDCPAHMSLVEDILETISDIRFIGANTPMLGLELARTHKPDVILLDICLPGMNGYTFYEHLQKQKSGRYIPVIGLSATALNEDREKALHPGFSRYLTKPINIPEFKQVITEVLRESKVR